MAKVQKKSMIKIQVNETIQGDDVKQIMYSPLSGRHEIFVHNANAPKIPHTPGRQRHFGLGGYCASTSQEHTLAPPTMQQP
jgi:hypothetical protein